MDKSECAAEVEHPIGGTEFIRNHGAGEDDGFVLDAVCQILRRLRHGVCAVGNEDAVALCGGAGMLDFRAFVFSKFERIFHEQRFGLQV